MSARWRLAYAGIVILAVLVVGTAGFSLIEDVSPFDAFFQTVVTIATAGAQGPQVTTVAGKLLTIALLVFGGGVLVYAVGTVARLALEGELADYFGGQRMRSRIDSLKDHFIICGFGRVGDEIAGELSSRSLPFVLVDTTPERTALAERRGYLLVGGDATQDETLAAAGVHRARCLIAASDSDANNTYITLSARALNPDIFIVARSSQAENERKLRQAGADRVVSPYTIAGRHMALSAIQPLILDFMPTPSTRKGEPILAQLVIEQGSPSAGRTVHEILSTCPTTTVLGLRRADGEVVVGPGSELRLSPGDELIVLGPDTELSQISTGRRAVPAG